MTDEVFKDIKSSAIKYIKTGNNKFGQVSARLKLIQKLENIYDNHEYILSRFNKSEFIEFLEFVKPENKKKCEEIYYGL